MQRFDHLKIIVLQTEKAALRAILDCYQVACSAEEEIPVLRERERLANAPLAEAYHELIVQHRNRVVICWSVIETIRSLTGIVTLAGID